MKATKIIHNYGVILNEEEFARRTVKYDSNTQYVEVFLDGGIICLVPVDNWYTLMEAHVEGDFNGD
jgi:hypothetical protein